MESVQSSVTDSTSLERLRGEELFPTTFHNMKELPQCQSAQRHRWAFLFGILTTILAVASILLLVPIASCTASTKNVFIPPDVPSTAVLEPCGKTHDEALARGCQFDLMSFVWTPPACHDKELLEDFLSLRNWTWYHDIEGMHIADAAQVRQGIFEHLFVTWEYHKVHCAYMWRKLHRAMMSGSPVDGYIGISNHTRHCLSQLDRKGIDSQSVNTHIIQKFPACGV